MSEYMTKSEARAVARWEVGSGVGDILLCGWYQHHCSINQSINQSFYLSRKFHNI